MVAPMVTALYALTTLGVLLLAVLGGALLVAVRAVATLQRTGQALVESERRAAEEVLGRVCGVFAQALKELGERDEDLLKVMEKLHLEDRKVTLEWLKENAGVGGLPRDLWMERHDLDKQKLEMQREQHEWQRTLSEPIMRDRVEAAQKDAAMRAVKMQMRGNGRLTNT